MRFMYSSVALSALWLGMSVIHSGDDPARASNMPPDAAEPVSLQDSSSASHADPTRSSTPVEGGGESEPRVDGMILMNRGELLFFSEKNWAGKPITLAQLGELVTGRAHILVKADPDVPMDLMKQVLERISKSGANVSISAMVVGESDLTTNVPQGKARLDELTQQLARIEKDVIAIMRQFVDLSAASEGTRTTAHAEFERKLREQVASAFELRQQLQRAELEEIRGRLSRIEQQISSREQFKEEIIARRVNEFLAAGELKKLHAPPTASVIEEIGIIVEAEHEYAILWPSPAQKLRGGLRIRSVNPSSPAARAGWRRDDILCGLDKWETISIENVKFALSHSTEPRIGFLILRGVQFVRGQIEVPVRPSGSPREGANAGLLKDAAAAPRLPLTAVDSPFSSQPATPRMSNFGAAPVDAGGSIIFRSPTAFQQAFLEAVKNMQSAERAINVLQSGLAKKDASPTIDELKRAHPVEWQNVEHARERVQLVRDEYAAQVKLLEREHEAAVRANQTTKERLDATKSLYEGGKSASRCSCRHNKNPTRRPHDWIKRKLCWTCIEKSD